MNWIPKFTRPFYNVLLHSVPYFPSGLFCPSCVCASVRYAWFSKLLGGLVAWCELLDLIVSSRVPSSTSGSSVLWMPYVWPVSSHQKVWELDTAEHISLVSPTLLTQKFPWMELKALWLNIWEKRWTEFPYCTVLAVKLSHYCSSVHGRFSTGSG